MNEIELTQWVFGFLALVLGIGGPVWGIAIASGERHADASSQSDSIKSIEKRMSRFGMMDDKLDRLIHADNTTQELIRNNTSVMEKIDTTLNTFMQIIAHPNASN